MRLIYSVLFAVFLSVNNIWSQFYELNKCGYPDPYMKSTLTVLGDKWGYSYDSLLSDISIWESNDNVELTDIGQSTQGRTLYELVITDQSISNSDKKRIYIHSRTHPNEVQAHWVTDQIIEFLLSDTQLGLKMRERCIFHIVPMYNPDGVELEYSRQNANLIDIESNWNASQPEIEVVNLKARFEHLMTESNPVRVALNMHSAYACKRYFVYHSEVGTSTSFAAEEREFIGAIKDHFHQGIEPYYYYESWTSGTPSQYPESWWWFNHAESVMALTYEDMNCSSAGFYDKTAYAMLHGISDFLDLGYASSIHDFEAGKLEAKAFPNPFEKDILIEWNNFDNASKAVVYNMLGKQIRTLNTSQMNNGTLIWDGRSNDGSEVPSGTYIIQLVVNNKAKSLIIIKQ